MTEHPLHHCTAYHQYHEAGEEHLYKSSIFHPHGSMDHGFITHHTAPASHRDTE